MTEKRFKVSLSELHTKRKFVAMAGEKVFDYCLFEIRYRQLADLKFYELRFPEENIQDVCSDNAVDIIDAVNEYFEAVLLP